MSNNESEAIHNIKHVKKNMLIMRKTKIKYPWTSLTTSKIRIFAFGIFHISFFKALLINEGERESGRNDPGRIGIGAKRLTGRTGFGAKRPWKIDIYCFSAKHVALRRKSKDWLSRSVVTCLSLSADCFSELAL